MINKILTKQFRFLFIIMAFVFLNISPNFSMTKLKIYGIVCLFVLLIFYIENELYEKRDFSRIKESYTVIMLPIILFVTAVLAFRLFMVNEVVDMLLILISTIGFAISGLFSLDMNILNAYVNIKNMKVSSGNDLIDVWENFIDNRERKESREYRIALTQKRASLKEGFYIIYDTSLNPSSVLLTDVVGCVMVLKNTTLKIESDDAAYNIHFFDIYGNIEECEVSDVFRQSSKRLLAIKMPSKEDFEEEKENKKSISIDVTEQKKDYIGPII